MFCPNCGKQNPDHAIACAFCEHPLERPKPRFKGTMMMTAPTGSAPEGGAASIGKPSDPPPARSPKKTMVGGFAIPPGGLQPPSAGGDGAAPLPEEPPKDAQQAPPARSPKKTMIGGFAIPPGGLTPPAAGSAAAGSPGPSAPSEPAASGAPSPKKTMIGGFTMPQGGLTPPGSAAEPEAPVRSPKKTMIGGFAMPQGGPAAPSADQPAEPEAKAAKGGAQWDYGDEDTPASVLTLPSEEETKRPSAEFDRTLVAGMISAADLPPPPGAADQAAAQSGDGSSDDGGDQESASKKLEPARKRSPMLLLLSATLAGVFALFIAYKTFVSGGAGGELEVEQHRFALEGVVSAILLTCEADPSGGAALDTIRLAEDSPLKATICDFNPSAIETIGDSTRLVGKRLVDSPAVSFPGGDRLDGERCVVFRAGSAMIVTCDTEEIGITPVYFQNIDEL